MKKILPILALAFLLIATPAIASKDKGLDNDNRANQQVSTCDPNANWKNHGGYVSCVARLHQGGKDVSAAAKSDIGKIEEEDEQENSPAPSASPTPSPSVSPSPSASPSGSPSASPNTSPSASPAANITESVNLELKALVEVLNNILTSLQKLI